MSEQYKITLLMSEFVTHDVKRFIFSKPSGFGFEPGQGVELAIDQHGWQKEGRPFTPTNFVDDEVLEFTIKAYPDHDGVTQKLHGLSAGSKLLMSEPFGTISYQGPGVFLAGGAGVTPFIAILRAQSRAAGNGRSCLIFSNKTPADVIYEKELRHYLGENCILTCTAEQAAGYEHRRVDQDFLREKVSDFSVPFYVCGPPSFMEAMTAALKELGADPQNLVFEQ